MNEDLDDLLHGAKGAIAGGVPPLEESRLQDVRGTIGRHRVRRHTLDSFRAVGAMAVVGAVAWWGLAPDDPAQVVASPSPTASATAEPSPSVTRTPTPTPTPSAPTPTAPPVRSGDVDDATVMERLTSPRTGEVWFTPTRVENPPVLVDAIEGDDLETILVGRHGEADIYALVREGRMPWVGVNIFEVDDAGARLIACPSSRPEDRCTYDVAVLAGGVARDTDTFYDSLTLPRSITLTNGWTISTGATTSPEWFMNDVYGDTGALLGVAPARQVVRDLGPIDVVQETLPSEVGGLSNVRIGIRTPFGSVIWLDGEDVLPGGFTSIRWDDGVTRYTPTEDHPVLPVTAPGADVCEGLTFSVEDVHRPSDWREAGMATNGHRVLVPATGGTDLSRAVRAWQEGASFGYDESYQPVQGAAAGYGYLTDESFLGANALFAVEGPTGQWLLGLRADAGAVVYECA